MGNGRRNTPTHTIYASPLYHVNYTSLSCLPSLSLHRPYNVPIKSSSFKMFYILLSPVSSLVRRKMALTRNVLFVHRSVFFSIFILRFINHSLKRPTNILVYIICSLLTRRTDLKESLKVTKKGIWVVQYESHKFHFEMLKIYNTFNIYTYLYKIFNWRRFKI